MTRFRHPVLSVPSLLPTVVSGGEWPVTYPSSCDLTIAVMYLPVQADGEGWGSAVRDEVQEWITRECARDDWLAEHPPAFDWWSNGVMPMEIPRLHADRGHHAGGERRPRPASRARRP